MKQFIDLEPILGTSDHLWTEAINELDSFPYRNESAYIYMPDHPPSVKQLKRDFVRVARERRDNPELLKLHNSSTMPSNPKAWTDEWNNYSKESRITLVDLLKNSNHYVEGNHIERNINLFPKVWAYIKSLPIKRNMRTIFILGAPHAPLPTHIDWPNGDPCEAEKVHMLFINPKNNRPFYYVKDGRKTFTNSSLFMFNNAAVEHGILAEEHRTFMIRIYCALEDDFCDKLGIYKVP